MNVNKHLDWHNNQWRSLWDTPAGPPHAMLLVGSPGLGKSLFATAMAQRLLCEASHSATASACGACAACRLFEAGNHLDYRRVIPEADIEDPEGGEGADGDKKKASAQILIGQIRALEDFVFVGGHRGGRRVIIIEPAEAMNASAANALLKILEEPPVGIYFILISSMWRRLLPTIRSRCRVVMFGRPELPAASDWLVEQGGKEALFLLPLTGNAPVLALDECQRGRTGIFSEITQSFQDRQSDFMTLAGRWEANVKKDGGLKMDELIAMLQKWLYDLARVKRSGALRFYPEMRRQAEAIAANTDIHGILNFYNELIKIRALAAHPLNPRLYLEDLAARYLRAIAPVRS